MNELCIECTDLSKTYKIYSKLIHGLFFEKVIKIKIILM